MPSSPRRLPTSPRRVLVTGAASGLGLALVRALVARGDQVLATDLQTRAARRAAVGGGIPAPRRAQRRRLGGGAGPRARHVGRARPARQQRRGRRRRAHRRRDDAGVGTGSSTSTCSASCAGAAPSPRSSSSRAAATSSTPPRSPGSCTRRGWRPTTRSRPASSRSARPCRTSWHRTGSTSRSCAPRSSGPTSGPPSRAPTPRWRRRASGWSAGRGAAPTRWRRSCVRGIDAKRDVILTDREGHLAWRAKRFVRPAYTAVMKRAAAKRLGA